MIGLRRTAEDQIANFGTVAGVWIESDRLLNVTEFSEKPTIDYARLNLARSGFSTRRIPDGLWSIYYSSQDL